MINYILYIGHSLITALLYTELLGVYTVLLGAAGYTFTHTRRGYPSGGCVGRSKETSETRSAPSRRRPLLLRVVAYGIYLSIYLYCCTDTTSLAHTGYRHTTHTGHYLHQVEGVGAL